MSQKFKVFALLAVREFLVRIFLNLLHETSWNDILIYLYKNNEQIDSLF